ncbi:hypothetical protein M430DRAFT_148556 [Amorphotheca resinae ATCC 22711]|uniref:GTPase-activating protein GYP5 n=1 Tax=Amorphotheca resinae ATCC 22711 TaxID=857342 RepID=A0A2T3AP81_AMORE|nr:hypothetical protein M430DRAFT_148556 [Amorphotheca resinae ATCC 22711]PSS06710.1 hypothetical protein M430DRAFT_148556 [Amorphotheca resinae ATCC 22711]
MSDHEHHDHDTADSDLDSVQERRPSTEDNAERENDTFEDAIGSPATTVETVKDTPVETTRSLTKHRSSSVKSTVQEIVPDSPDSSAVSEVTEPQTNGDDEHEIRQPKSPLLTSHRLSTTSLDNVNLEEDGASGDEGTPNPSEVPKPVLPPRSSKPSLQGLSGALPSVPWAAPPPPPPPPVSSAPPPIKRSITSPFSWLSRNTSSAPKETPKETPAHPTAPSPDNAERRNTASSIVTISSNPELMLSKLEGEPDGSSKQPARNSLKDRFKLLRMREEAGITSLGEDDKKGSTTAGPGPANHTSVVEEKEMSSTAHRSSVAQGPNPSVSMGLSPGTASGAFAGPSAINDPASAVDWDLWQSVVYEGPAAVARTSADELNRAISTGIPSAIRGVVWQVLAQSKNDELESVYRDLVVRGTDKDKDRMSGSSGPPSITQSHSSPKEEIRSSSSSIHSDHSPPTVNLANGTRSPSPLKEKDIEAVMKAKAAEMAEKKKKAKEDAAALQKLEKMIKRDLGSRTSFSKFAASAGLQEGLFGVCKAYALFDEGVGYAQGMNFLVMPLLFNMPEEEAFCLLVRLMNQYHLRDLFIQDMPGLHKHLYQFERLLEDLEPALYCHLHRRHITPHLYATQWFLTLFAYRFPLQLVLRIYDLILSEGLEAIIKFGIVLMQKNAATLLGMNDMMALTNFLRDRLFDVYIDQAPSQGSILESGFFGSSGSSIDKEIYRADQMIQDACAVKLTPELLKAYAVEWEEKTKLEKDREAELEHLKSSNQALIQKVRRLEERVEEHDTEHAALATELVRTKVENEELQDRNESLNGQVEELRKVVERQPGEVEERLKSEMERLMKRNQEVHEENTRLEEEMSAMEKDLVETKMQYAELNSAHETLNRKWTDLRKALD